MKSSGMAGIIVLIAVLCMGALLCMAVPAQSLNAAAGQTKPHARRQPVGSPTLKHEFVPHVIARADSFIINGHIVALHGQRLSVETARGERLDFQLDGQTTLLDSSELVSIATMDDITLRPSDLRLADEVEVVAERAGNRRFARIVTRTASGQPVARR